MPYRGRSIVNIRRLIRLSKPHVRPTTTRTRFELVTLNQTLYNEDFLRKSDVFSINAISKDTLISEIHIMSYLDDSYQIAFEMRDKEAASAFVAKLQGAGLPVKTFQATSPRVSFAASQPAVIAYAFKQATRVEPAMQSQWQLVSELLGVHLKRGYKPPHWIEHGDFNHKLTHYPSDSILQRSQSFNCATPKQGIHQVWVGQDKDGGYRLYAYCDNMVVCKKLQDTMKNLSYRTSTCGALNSVCYKTRHQSRIVGALIALGKFDPSFNATLPGLLPKMGCRQNRIDGKGVFRYFVLSGPEPVVLKLPVQANNTIKREALFQCLDSFDFIVTNKKAGKDIPLDKVEDFIKNLNIVGVNDVCCCLPGFAKLMKKAANSFESFSQDLRRVLDTLFHQGAEPVLFSSPESQRPKPGTQLEPIIRKRITSTALEMKNLMRL